MVFVRIDLVVHIKYLPSTHFSYFECSLCFKLSKKLSMDVIVRQTNKSEYFRTCFRFCPNYYFFILISLIKNVSFWGWWGSIMVIWKDLYAQDTKGPSSIPSTTMINQLNSALGRKKKKKKTKTKQKKNTEWKVREERKHKINTYLTISCSGQWGVVPLGTQRDNMEQVSQYHQEGKEAGNNILHFPSTVWGCHQGTVLPALPILPVWRQERARTIPGWGAGDLQDTMHGLEGWDSDLCC